MIVIVIPAKGGSTRLPNKNMTPVNGRPMLDYTIEAARNSNRADAIYISTDSDTIAAHAATRGIPVIRRPESLGGEVPIIEVYRHALKHMPRSDEVKILVGLQPDHPDRQLSVDETLTIFREKNLDVLGSMEANGTKNGAHYVLSRHFLDTGDARRKDFIVDDCTNIHFEADVQRAAQRLRAQGPA